jgi:PPOX class probable F420-dependent enzyme
MVLNIDRSTDFGRRVLRRLETEVIGWLTTVRADGTPQPSPIWFLWDGATILIYSQREKPKLRNIAGNPKVSFSLDSDGTGGNIVILNGEAIVESSAPSVDQNPEYLSKYHGHILRIGMTNESFAGSYSVPIRVTPTKLRGH